MDLERCKKDFEKNHHCGIVKKSSGKYGGRGSTIFDTKDEKQAWIDLIGYFKEEGIYNYDYLLDK